MDSPPPRRIVGILTPGHRQAPFLEFSLHTKRWLCWLSYNDNATAGTYLDLYAGNPLDQRFIGQADRVVIGPNGAVDRITTVLQHL